MTKRKVRFVACLNACLKINRHSPKIRKKLSSISMESSCMHIEIVYIILFWYYFYLFIYLDLEEKTVHMILSLSTSRLILYYLSIFLWSLRSIWEIFFWDLFERLLFLRDLFFLWIWTEWVFGHTFQRIWCVVIQDTVVTLLVFFLCCGC